jgi:hypothetical protein
VIAQSVATDSFRAHQSDSKEAKASANKIGGVLLTQSGQEVRELLKLSSNCQQPQPPACTLEKDKPCPK